ncbi:MAG: hypothetical protein ACI94Y_000056 [Maribacter sp.]|jgi:hypothetical protein
MNESKKTKILHVLSFNVPFPADYGGVIGVFYHLKALHELGVEIILHCYQYGRKPAKELDAMCKEVHYYSRDMSLKNMISGMPFIVKTRKHPLLLERLLEDDYPILFEGTHVCYFLSHPALKNRTKMVRMHNVEWQYYENMIPLEKDPKKKWYFKWESQKLKNYELVVVKDHADAILAVSPKETAYFNENGFENVHYVSAFHPNERVEVLAGRGDYVLFHGDLSVKENELIARQMINEVFIHLPEHQLIVAGRCPSKELLNDINQADNVSLKNDVSNEEMESLIKNAQINLLRAFQPAGMKLKLLNALYKGRFVLVNSHMVKNTGLDELCTIVEEIKDVPSRIRELMQQDFDSAVIEKRRQMLDIQFSNVEKAKITLSLMQ